LRGIQLYDAAEYHCDETTEDGYALGPGSRTCRPHDTDYAPQDWRFSLSELLRLIQFYNLGGYAYCPEAQTEDDFCLVFN